MKIFYIAVQIKENEKYYAYALKVSNMDNLLSKLEIKGVVSANFLGTKKHTEEVVKSWNDAYKANGTYLFDTPSF
jgi:predicted ATPase